MSTSQRQRDRELRRTLAPLNLALCRVGPHVVWQREMSASGYICKQHEAARAKEYRRVHGAAINVRRSIQRAGGDPDASSPYPLMNPPTSDYDDVIRESKRELAQLIADEKARRGRFLP